jgi:asparagine synthetase B (glutamine-hydrolysing)
MSAALLFLWRSEPLTDADRERFDRVAASFPTRLLERPHRSLESPDALVRVWARAGEAEPAAHEHGEHWLALAGNPTRADLGAPPADALAKRLLADRLTGSSAPLSPPFALVWREGPGRYEVEVDRSGLQHLYVRDEPGALWIASSSLALAAVAPTDVDVDAVAEWLSVGHFISDRTLLRAIRKLGPGERLTIAGGEVRRSAAWRPVAASFTGDPTGAYVASLVRSVRASHSGKAVALELTGGLDTRVLLAVHLARGLPIHAWTIGQDGCDELRTIERLRRRFAFSHRSVPVPPSFARRLPDLVPDFHELSDGEVSSLEYAPLLLAFEQGVAEGRHASITGGGAELARGFYFGVLGSDGRAVRGVPVEALHRKVTRYTEGVAELIRPELHSDPIAASLRVIEDFVRSSEGQTPGSILEDFYLRTRMQRFAGRNTTTTGAFYRQAAPFFDDELVDLVFSLPHESKRDGQVVRDAIARLCPGLTRVPLDTGMPVRSVSWRHPATQAARAVSFGRRGLVKFGGRAGAAIARRPPPPIPWSAATESNEFRDFAFDLLTARDARIGALCDRGRVEVRVREAFEGGSLYPAGLLLTLELTLRKLEAVTPRDT